MKRLITSALALPFLLTVIALPLRAETSPGQIDFGQFTPPGNGANYVDINLNHTLISLAAQMLGKQEPDAAKLLQSVEMLRVNVVGVTDENREDVTKYIQSVRGKLDKDGWGRIVTVQDKNGADVGIFVKTRGEEAVEGIVVTVIDAKKNAVLINLVGNIKPEQIAAVGEALHIDPLKKVGEALKH